MLGLEAGPEEGYSKVRVVSGPARFDIECSPADREASRSARSVGGPCSRTLRLAGASVALLALVGAAVAAVHVGRPSWAAPQSATKLDVQAQAASPVFMCEGEGKCGGQFVQAKAWTINPADLATQVGSLQSLPGVDANVWGRVSAKWRSTPAALPGGATATLDSVASFMTSLLKEQPFAADAADGNSVPYVSIAIPIPGKVVSISQRQLAFIVANVVMGNDIQGSNGLSEALRRCTNKDQPVISLMSFLAVCSEELKDGSQGGTLVGAMPRQVDGNTWGPKLNDPMVEPALCRKAPSDNANDVCTTPDFMSGGKVGQALIDIAGGVVGGGALLCAIADSQDESLVQFYSEVLAFAFFVPKGGQSMIATPFTLMGARRYVNMIEGDSQATGTCGKFADTNWVNQGIMTVKVPATLGGRAVSIYGSSFVAVASECSDATCAGCSNSDRQNNNCPCQLTHVDKDVNRWFGALSADTYNTQVQGAFRSAVKSVGTGPWGAGAWHGDSQQYFALVWLANNLLSGPGLDYYIYQHFCENPGNQCFVLGGQDCQACIGRAKIGGVRADRCGKVGIYDFVNMYKGKPASELYNKLKGANRGTAALNQVFDLLATSAAPMEVQVQAQAEPEPAAQSEFVDYSS